MSLLSAEETDALETVARSVALVRPDLGKVLRSVLSRLEATDPCMSCGLFDIGATFNRGTCPHCDEVQRRDEALEARGGHL